LRILITSLPLGHVGGIENYANLLIKNLRNQGHKINHFTKGLKAEHFNKFKNFMPFITFRNLFKFRNRLLKFNPDVVHLNPSLLKYDLPRALLFLRIAKAQGYPVLFFIRGWRWPLYKKIKNNDIIRKTFVNNLQKADKILVLSRDFKDALVEIGINEDKIELTSTMVEVESYSPKNKTFDKPYNVLFCSRIAEDKGPNELVEAIPQVIENEEDVNFIFMGDGPELENVKRKAKEIGVDGYVTFTGYKTGEEKYEIYKKSHIFVFPTYHGEGFPNVALEAMATGLPVITTRNAGLKRAIEDGENGYFLNSMPSDPKEIAEKIIKLLNNSKKMEEISERNLRKAKEKYDVAAVSEEIKEIYKEMTKNPSCL